VSFHGAQLDWSAVTTDLGGGPLTGLAGYRVYGSQNPASLILMADTASAAILTWTFPTLQPYGTWYFYVTAYDPLGNESPHSARVSKPVIDDGPGGGMF